MDMMDKLNINLGKLNYTFIKKPLLVGGKAMEYYGLRKSGADIDFVVPYEDLAHLIQQYPDRVKDLWGDLGVCPFEFEIWKSICLLTYDDLKDGAIENGNYLIISLEKLLLLKVLGIKEEKYLKDTQLISERILNQQYKKYDAVKSENEEILKGLSNLAYIEKAGPDR
jgi:hypothetical protein